MADEMDRMVIEARDAVMHLAVLLGSVMLKLPIPIALPEGVVEMRDVVNGIERAAALAEFEPLPEEIRDNLRGACVWWLCAFDLLIHFEDRPRGFRIAGTFRCLELARADLLALGVFILPEEPQED